jgi:hypothetical protein
MLGCLHHTSSSTSIIYYIVYAILVLYYLWVAWIPPQRCLFFFHLLPLIILTSIFVLASSIAFLVLGLGHTSTSIINSPPTVQCRGACGKAKDHVMSVRNREREMPASEAVQAPRPQDLSWHCAIPPRATPRHTTLNTTTETQQRHSTPSITSTPKDRLSHCAISHRATPHQNHNTQQRRTADFFSRLLQHTHTPHSWLRMRW